jgi:phosphoglycolate phosphatase-like HAD superfamily hydrolase
VTTAAPFVREDVIVVFREDALSPVSEGLWLAAVEHLARRFKAIRPLATDELSSDRALAGRELDDWAGSDLANWRSELERFYGDHAGVQLRRDPAVGELLRQLRGSGARLAVYGVGPREASAAVLSFLGLDRRLDAVVLEPDGDPLAAACSALGVADPDGVRHVQTRAEVDEL